MKAKKAVVLLSGGLDSQITLQLALSQHFEVYALSFDYGQRHAREMDAAIAIAQKAGIIHQIVTMKLGGIAKSSLTQSDIAVEAGDLEKSSIPNTYVPARNMIFLSVAASYAESVGAQDIFIGVSEVDYSGYVDCRESFIDAMEAAINQGTVCAVEENRPIKIHAPFIHQTKKEEILLGQQLSVDFSLSWSCYLGGDKPCKQCDSCLLRMKAFKEAGVIDPSYL